MEPNRFAAVILSLGGNLAEKPYFYRIPPSLAGKVSVGSWVEVPLRSRYVRGWVVGFADRCPVAEGEVKDIRRILSDADSLVNPELFELCQWIAEVYLCPLGLVLRSLGMAGLRRSSRTGLETVRLAVSPDAAKEYLERLGRRAPRQAEALRILLSRGVQRIELRQLGIRRPVLKALEARGLVTLESVTEALRLPQVQKNSSPPSLTREQRAVLAEVVRAVRAGKFRSFLLHGVTGSGKTEIYLRAIAATLALGKQAIFLVPEIALTPQMVEYLRERFGSKVAVLHSRLSQSERSQEWRRLARGEAQVVVGARSAVFAPVPRLGLVVLDEEHESSYKQEVAPRYHTREVALRRAQMSSAVVLMGSATPTLETYYWARQGVHKLLVLEERVDGKEMPRIEVVDMREELRRGNSGIFSGHLERRMDEVLARGEQVLLFLNRRGYYPVLICRECGRALKCRFCDITLTYHRNGPVLRCHYCGFSLSSVPRCPSCGQDAWVGLGTGTQRVEEEIRRRWPGVRILRLDRDVVRYRGAHEKIYRSFLRGEADVLIGTQMVAKGFNFPRLTLVGVVNADITLNLPDFRARERTFQLLTQVAGRAGRGEKPGEVVVQTYFPEDYSIRMASRHDYLGFYRQEIRQRRRLGYPPFSHLVLVMVSSVKEERARSAASELYGLLTEKEAPAVRVLGPAPAPRAKLEGKYRYQLILKGRPISALREKLKEVLSRWSPKRDVQIAIDFNPLLNV